MHEVVLLHTDVILYANPQFADLLGMDRMELVGRSLSEFVLPDQAELVAASLHSWPCRRRQRRPVRGGPEGFAGTADAS